MSDKRPIDKPDPQVKDDKDDPRNRLNLIDEYKPPPRPTTAEPEMLRPSAPGKVEIGQLLPQPGQALEVPRVDLAQMASGLNKEKLRAQSVDQLAALYIADPEGTQRSVNKVTAAERAKANDYLTDAGAIGIGLVTKYGVDKLLSKGPGWTRPIGLLAGAAAAGLGKDLLSDGELGTGTDWLRGAGVYGGSMLLIKGMAMNPSRATLSAGTLEGISARTGVTGLAGTSAQVSEQLIAGNVGSPVSRVAQYFNPINYTGLTWHNGIRLAGFGGERSAALMAEGGMGFASFNARRNIGQLATTFGSAYAFGATREAVYIGTGQTTTDGNAYDLNTALSDINTSGLKLGATAALLMPAVGTATRLVPGGGRLLDTGAGLAGKFSPTSDLTFKALLPVAAAGGFKATDHNISAASIETRAAHARALVERARADEQLRR